MDTFELKNYNEKEFVLMNASDLNRIYDCILNEEAFIVEYKENEETKSEIVLGELIMSKMKIGEIKLKA